MRPPASVVGFWTYKSGGVIDPAPPNLKKTNRDIVAEKCDKMALLAIHGKLNSVVDE